MRCRRFLIASAIAASQIVVSAQRPPAAASDIKAAYLYQFGRYVEWPTALDDLTVCVVGDEAVASALQTLSRGDTGAGRVVVRRGPIAGTSDAACRIVFIGRDEPDTAALLKALDGKPTLAVGDDPAFLRGGGMIAFIPQGPKIRFSVNLGAAQAAHLRVSSQLLKLAVDVIR